MVIKSFKIVFFTSLFTFFATTPRAEIVQEITEGCTTEAAVFGLCIISSPFYTTTTIVVVPSEWSGTGFGAKSKIIYQAKNDAAMYVATNGEVKGTYLAAAINLLQAEDPKYKRVDDLTLAKAILAFAQKTAS